MGFLFEDPWHLRYSTKYKATTFMTCTGLPSNQEERQGRGRWQTLTCSKGLRGKCYVLGCFSCCYTCMYTIKHGYHLQKQTTATNSQNLQKSGFLFRWYSTVVKKSLITAIISAKNIVIGLLGHVASSWWIWGQKHRETAGRWDHVGHQPVETVQTNDLRALLSQCWRRVIFQLLRPWCFRNPQQ